MVGAAILHGDIVIVRKQDTADDGDIVVALLNNEEATVKRLRRDGNTVKLTAENPDYQPIIACGDCVCIQGKVIAVWRYIEEKN